MKLNKDFIIHRSGGETLLVPTGGAGFSGVVRGNNTLGAVLRLLQEDITEEKLVACMRADFDAPDGAIEKDVAKALAELRGIGAIDE